jgi:hypothetical protein
VYFNNKETLSNTCEQELCNSKMKEFIVDNSWSFNDSSNIFKECKSCDSKWFRASEFKTSDNGKKWIKHENAQDAYDDIKM